MSFSRREEREGGAGVNERGVQSLPQNIQEYLCTVPNVPPTGLGSASPYSWHIVHALARVAEGEGKEAGQYLALHIIPALRDSVVVDVGGGKMDFMKRLALECGALHYINVDKYVKEGGVSSSGGEDDDKRASFVTADIASFLDGLPGSGLDAELHKYKLNVIMSGLDPFSFLKSTEEIRNILEGLSVYMKPGDYIFGWGSVDIVKVLKEMSDEFNKGFVDGNYLFAFFKK